MPDRHASTARQVRNTARRPESGDARADRASQPAKSRVSVLLPLPLDRAYDYLVPPELALAPGDLVRVPLGSRELLGVVWESGRDSGEIPPERLKPVAALCEVPPLLRVQRRFIEWLADYAMVPWGAVLRMALSARSAFDPPKPITAFRLGAGGMDVSGSRMTPARRRVLSVLSEGPARPARELAQAAGVGPSVVKGLIKLGAIEAVDLPQPPAFEAPDWRRSGAALSPAQCDAATALRASVRQASAGGEGGVDEADFTGFSVTLLDGVTGSGKTEVYLEAVAEALEAGRQVLVLLPEIALTAQWLDRFRLRFGVAPAQWHSDLSQRQRRTAWRAVADGEAQVVVGARSALFLPYRDLGLIVVDEEHDQAFKQEDGVIYHARDMAPRDGHQCEDRPIRPAPPARASRCGPHAAGRTGRPQGRSAAAPSGAWSGLAFRRLARGNGRDLRGR
jgi:primosomal protein N' (replication factor Y)